MNEDVRLAVKLLLNDELVAFPTETVYGLGGYADSSIAISKIFEIKARPITHPLILHVYDKEDLEFWAEDIPAYVYTLLDKYSPGPISFLLKARSRLRREINNGSGYVVIRIPDHIVARSILKELRFNNAYSALVAPSANKFGHISATRAEDIVREFNNKIFVLNNSGCSPNIGIESTIIDCRSQDVLSILRPGYINYNDLKSLGLNIKNTELDTPLVSGSLKKHYSPNIGIFLGDIKSISAHTIPSSSYVSALLITPIELNYNNRLVIMPNNPLDYSRIIYSELYNAELMSDYIVIELPPDDISWAAVRDRLFRSSVY